MRTVGIVEDARFLAHDPGPYHPERPERLEVIGKLLATEEFRGLPRIDARAADEEELTRVHAPALIRAVAASAGRALTHFDADTAASAASFGAATLAAGSAIALADAVMAKSVDCGFAALRPPGHHAEADRAMGFCFFNNVAIVAQHLRVRHGLERILVLDWDVHHGNGTQHSFYDDSAVLYASLHQYPFYPGTGAAEEIGRGAGSGFTANAPMPAGSGHEDYLATFRDLLLPVAREFAPQFVLVSAGFDAHRDDPLASIELTAGTFGAMTDAVVALADEHSAGRILLLLEGGYELSALRDSVQAALRSLLSPAPFAPAEGELNSWGRSAVEALSSYWTIG